MSTPSATVRHIFGVRRDVAGCLVFHDEQTVVYPSGTSCIVYNIDQKQQKFILGSERSRGMTAMALSQNRRYVAVAERGDKEKGEKATIVVYDLHSLRKRKTLNSPEVQSEEYVSLTFSPDSKYLAAQSAGPDWTLHYWSWEKSKIMASVKTSNQQNTAAINQVTFNPQDNAQLCVVGNGIFKLFRYTEGSLKQFAFQKLDPQNYLCQAWVSDERVVVGTDTGRLVLFELGEVKAEFNLAAMKTKSHINIEADASIVQVSYAVTAIVPYSKGFACALGPDTVYIYEKTDDKEFFRKTREVKLPQDLFSVDPMSPQQQIINCVTMSPSEEVLVCSTSKCQLYLFTLSSTDLGKGDGAQFEMLSDSFHSAEVSGLDVCIRKPLIATCSTDRSVRIWNFETSTLEFYKEFAEEAYSVALHPSGLYVLVGFSDKLRLMNLLIDDIRTFREFPVRGCRECCFSHGGHYFAAVFGNVVQIYSTSTFENVSNLKGHSGKVCCVLWSIDDTKLVSCGVDGAVYEWETLTGRRISENVLKMCSYSSVALTPDGKTTFAVGSDHTLKEISDSQILRSVETPDTTLQTVALSHSGRMMFTGTSSGAVRAMKFPLTVPGEWVEYPAHCAAITKMRITHDDQYLITVSEDGCVIIWRILDKEGRNLKRDKEFAYAEEILITKSDLEDKNALMADLKTRVEELRMENEYQLRLKDMNYSEKIKELTEKFIQEMELLKNKNQGLKTDKDKEEMKHEEELREVVEKHTRELQDLESTNNQKLMLEYEKFQELQVKSQRMQEDYEHQLSEMEEKRKQAVDDITEFYEAELQAIRTKLEQSLEESKQTVLENEEMKRQIEEDADRELLNMRTKHEHIFHDQQETNLKLRGETGIMRKKFTSMNKEIEDFKEEIRKGQTEVAKLNNVIRNLEKDITGLKKEIQERDETIQDKEKRIYDLKKKNQELEKFKFVLDYKIKELKKQIEPRENEIKAMKVQIQDMEGELERSSRQNALLELNIDEIRQKLKATEKEMFSERQKAREIEATVRRFKTDLHNTIGYIQDPKLLKDSIKAMYQKHVQEDIAETANVDADIQKEFARQREHLERSVATLRKKLVKDAELHRSDNVRIMQENVTLIKEINDLRRELKMSRGQVHDLEAAIGLHRKNNVQSRAASEALRQSTTTNKNALMERELLEKRKVVDMQKDEIFRLHDELEKLLLSPPNSRPGSTGSIARLPPVDNY